MNSAKPNGPGFFGKAPAHGDFIARRVPDAVVGKVDTWLQQCLAASRATLVERWVEVFRISPLWRFAVSANIWSDEGAVCGVMMPSVDRVGRYFPMVAIYEFQSEISLTSLPFSAKEWFSDLESVLLGCLEDAFDIDAFDDELLALGPPPSLPKPSALTTRPSVLSGGGFEMTADRREDFEEEPLHTLELLALGLSEGMSIWWSNGSDSIVPRFAMVPGLPEIGRFVGLLEDRE